jgi:hypothetical protein
MVLTGRCRPDVGAGRTKAVKQEDGLAHRRCERFITSGAPTTGENIIHLVLARPRALDGAGPVAVRSSSTRRPAKERNGVFVTNSSTRWA